MAYNLLRSMGNREREGLDFELRDFDGILNFFSCHAPSIIVLFRGLLIFFLYSQ